MVERQPSVFLSADALLSNVTGYTPCDGSIPQNALNGAAALARNGTVNDCANPAVAGSTVTIFLNGLGVVTTRQNTGSIASAPAQPLTPVLDFAPYADEQVIAIATTTLPGAIGSVAQAQLQLPTAAGTATLRASVAGSPLPVPVIIWTTQATK